MTEDDRNYLMELADEVGIPATEEARASLLAAASPYDPDRLEVFAAVRATPSGGHPGAQPDRVQSAAVEELLQDVAMRARVIVGPVVVRELQVASRAPRTWQARAITAPLSVIVEGEE